VTVVGHHFITLTVDICVCIPYNMASCLSALHAWFTRNGVALCGNKSEARLFDTRQRLRAFSSIHSLTVAGSQVSYRYLKSIAFLGVTVDSTHIFSICKSVYFHMTALRYVRRALDDSSCMLSPSHLFSHDWTTAGLQSIQIFHDQLQRDQKYTARTVLANLNSRCFFSSRLHSLPITSRIKTKLKTISYKSLSVAQVGHDPFICTCYFSSANQYGCFVLVTRSYWLKCVYVVSSLRLTIHV